jgi:molecular chaperone DnaK (HSP70)
LQELGIEPVKVVTDFLSHVREVTVESIWRTYGKEFVHNADIECVLTAPAIWTDSAKDLMVTAATNAGFGKHRLNFNLVSEPEAAAAYTLGAIQPSDLNVGSSVDQVHSHVLISRQIGDAFIICDAGGGTVVGCDWHLVWPTLQLTFFGVRI